MHAHAELVKDLVLKDLRARYKTSSMGFFWSVLNPLMMILLFTFVFSRLLRIQPPPGIRSFALFVFSGFLPWFALQEGLIRSTSSILDNSSLVKTVRFPVAILPLYLVLSGIVNETIGIGLLLPLAAYSQGVFPTTVVLILPILCLQAMFCLGLGWVLAILQVYMRDTIQILGVFLTVWLYLTPVFWPPGTVPAGYAFLLDLNPMHHLLIVYRAVLLQAKWPPFYNVACFSAVSLIVFYVGYGVIMKQGRSLTDLV